MKLKQLIQVIDTAHQLVLFLSSHRRQPGWSFRMRWWLHKNASFGIYSAEAAELSPVARQQTNGCISAWCCLAYLRLLRWVSIKRDQRNVMLLSTLLPPELAFFVVTAGSAKTFQKRNVSSGAAVQTEVPSGLCDMCNALAVWPVSSPICNATNHSAGCFNASPIAN